MKKIIVIILVGLLFLLIIPILITQFSEEERRSFKWVTLNDMEYQEVSFRNTSQDLELGGMLFVPEEEGSYRAVVIIHGSGTSRRDNGWYLTLTKHLQDNGILVLMPDKRGSEASEGVWQTASFEDLATDTEAAIGFLYRQNDHNLTDIGIIGLSQGGRIAPLVVDRANEDIAFVVNVSGGALPMFETLVYEEKNNLRNLGILPGLSDFLAYPAAWSLIYWRQSDFYDAIGNFDPRPYWSRLSIPALVLYGENDSNLPTEKSAEALRALENRNIDVRIYKGSGHTLESPEGLGDRIFREDALKEITDFIHSVDTRQSGRIN